MRALALLITLLASGAAFAQNGALQEGTVSQPGIQNRRNSLSHDVVVLAYLAGTWGKPARDRRRNSIETIALAFWAKTP